MCPFNRSEGVLLITHVLLDIELLIYFFRDHEGLNKLDHLITQPYVSLLSRCNSCLKLTLGNYTLDHFRYVTSLLCFKKDSRYAYSDRSINHLYHEVTMRSTTDVPRNAIETHEYDASRNRNQALYLAVLHRRTSNATYLCSLPGSETLGRHCVKLAIEYKDASIIINLLGFRALLLG